MPVPPLPEELIVTILRYAAPHTVEDTAWYWRRQTLLACCLVSKHFLHMARPLLWEAIHLSSGTKIAVPSILVREARGGLARFTKALCITKFERDLATHDDRAHVYDDYIDDEEDDLPLYQRGIRFHTILDLLACFPNLVELRLNNLRPPDGAIPRYASFRGVCCGVCVLLLTVATTALERLTLLECDLDAPYSVTYDLSPSIDGPTWTFAKLKHLSIRRCDRWDAANDPLCRLFVAAVLPSLRTLRYSTSRGGAYPFQEVALLTQLDVLEVDKVGDLPPPLTLSETSITILRCVKDFPGSLSTHTRHLAIVEESSIPIQHDADPDDLDLLASIIRTQPLTSLFLPTCFCSSSAPRRGTLDPPMVRARDALLAACAEQGVHVGWSPADRREYGCEHEYALPEFCAYIAERKRAGAVDQGGRERGWR